MEDEEWSKDLNLTENDMKMFKSIKDTLLVKLTDRDKFMILNSIKKFSQENERINRILILNGEESSDLSLSERLELLLDQLK